MNLCHMALLCAALPGCALHAAAGAEGDRRGILRKSQDGKSLQLMVASGMMMIFR